MDFGSNSTETNRKEEKEGVGRRKEKKRGS